MKIFVPLKRVPDPYAKATPNLAGDDFERSNTKWDINPFDEIALEAAVRLREGGLETEIIIASVGGSECEELLRKGLAMGADRAVLLQTDARVDSGAVAALLSDFVKTEGFDLVLMGKQSTDFDNNQAGQRLAARLGWPQITSAAKISVSGTSLSVVRESDSGEQQCQTSLPTVVTCDLRLAEPRYIALPGIIKARSKPLETRPVTAPSSKTRVTKIEAAPSRPAGRKVASVDELVSALKEAGAL